MKKKPNSGRRRFRHHRHGMMHVSHGIAHVAASLYFLLSRGNAEQRQAAEEWRAMFTSLRTPPTS